MKMTPENLHALRPAESDSALHGGVRRKGVVAQGSASAPLVTVITSVFNARHHIAGCIESVMRQDYPNIEHIVIDGGSTDGTVDVLRGFDGSIAFWRSAPDKGIYDAWNKGLAEARGEWICFIGADDELLPGAVTAYMQLARSNPQAEFLCSRIQWVNPSGYRRIRGKAWRWPEFARWMSVSHPGSMHRRSLYNRLGTYDLSFGSAADYELLLRARQTLHAAYMPQITAVMRAGGVSDGLAALADAARAQTASGGRSPLLAHMELQIARVKALLRPIRRWLSRTVDA